MNIPQLTHKANQHQLTDADLKNIQAAGLRLVCHVDKEKLKQQAYRREIIK